MSPWKKTLTRYMPLNLSSRRTELLRGWLSLGIHSTKSTLVLIFVMPKANTARKTTTTRRYAGAWSWTQPPRRCMIASILCSSAVSRWAFALPDAPSKYPHRVTRTKARMQAKAMPKASSMPKFLSTMILVTPKVPRPAMVVSALMMTGVAIWADEARIFPLCWYRL
ncbi:MAG: hypothetical protein BWX71_02519 [Deltaproteobacteria bacterium ADurb.Bin072]|nr:MAG: hypothetical protein BWX71_02519 [Deltaproteobacteria bacterium ADurb.Bin072]